MQARNLTMTASLVQEIKTLGAALTKEGLSDSPSSSQCAELVSTLSSILSSPDNNINISILEQTLIGKTLTKVIKSFKRHRRTSSPSSTLHSEWDGCIAKSETLLVSLKQIVPREHSENKAKKVQAEKKELSQSGLPKSASVYKIRLETQKKEIYKNPPALPPVSVSIEEVYVPEPKRDKKTGELTFICGQDDAIKTLLKDFKPNRSPEEILRSGSFGGTYYRPIVSAVTNIKYKAADVLQSSVKAEWIQGLNKGTYLTNTTYVPSINKYKVKCGGSLGMWESSGWIADCDPYGWFQWYCRFYQGRRCDVEDVRQIGRWLKVRGSKHEESPHIFNLCRMITQHSEKVI